MRMSSCSQALRVARTESAVTADLRAKSWGNRSVALLVVLLSLLLAVGGRRTKAQATDEEYRVKAAFIFHFAQLVDWPPDTQTGTDNSLSLCTLGEDPFQGTLEETVAGKTIG